MLAFSQVLWREGWISGRLSRPGSIQRRAFSRTFSVSTKYLYVVCLISPETVVGKVTSAPSTNIFTNRETENQLRSMNLRRMSYILLCGEKNQFLTSLPSIQEKLVDVLKNTSAPVVQAEVYLCVRVLMCRLSQHNLDSFWPVILSEMAGINQLFDSASCVDRSIDSIGCWSKQ
jgi:hypothetical protein